MEIFNEVHSLKNEVTWTDSLFQARKESMIWKKTSYVLIVALFILSVGNGILIHFSIDKLNRQRLLLVAPGQNVGPVEIPAETQISPAVLMAFSKKVVMLNEQWSYESLAENMDELFRYFYSDDLENVARSNLKSTDRLNIVQEKEMVSVFKIDWKNSEATWCGKIRRGCALISGTRKLYMDNNRPLSSRPVSYLIFFEALYPSLENPHAMRVTRLITEDSSENAFDIIKTQFEMAKKGEINEY